jgi:hypothetical protein
MKTLFSFFFLFCLIKSVLQQMACGGKLCDSVGGICVFNSSLGQNMTSNYNSTGFFCNCTPRFSTFPNDSQLQCSYKLYSQKTAFLLELFLSFGAGHFYIKNYQIAIPKLLFWLVGYYLFIILRMVTKKTEENNTTALLVALIGCIFCFGMLTWQVVDCFLFGFNLYNDGNGVTPYSFQN